MEKNRINDVALFTEEILDYGYSGFFKLPYSSAIYKFVWITAADDDGLYSAFDDGLCARRLFSRMAAGFEGGIHF